MKSKIISFLITSVVLFYIAAQSLQAQETLKYVVFSVSANVVQFKDGTKLPVKKGQIIEDKTIVDIPAGESIQIIDRKNKLVMEIKGKSKNRLSVLAKNVEKPASLTGKFLAFLKDGITDNVNNKSMHEQKAGTIFRDDDDLLIDNDSIETDSVEVIGVKE